MPPTAPVKHYSEDVTRGISLNIEVEQAIAEAEQRSKAQSAYGPAAARADHLGTYWPFGWTSLEHAHIAKLTNIERFESSIQFLPCLVRLPQCQPRIAICRRVCKIGAISQHLERVVYYAKIYQLTADP